MEFLVGFPNGNLEDIPKKLLEEFSKILQDSLLKQLYFELIEINPGEIPEETPVGLQDCRSTISWM